MTIPLVVLRAAAIVDTLDSAVVGNTMAIGLFGSNGTAPARGGRGGPDGDVGGLQTDSCVDSPSDTGVYLLILSEL